MEEKYDIWKEGLEKPSFPLLKDSIETDILIIGGGLTGVLSAYLLAKTGKKVVLIQKGEIGEGATDATTAFLTSHIDTDYTELISILGKDDAGLVQDSHQTAIDLIESIIKEESIDCEFTRCSNVIYSYKNSDIGTLAKEYDAMRSLGLDVNFTTMVDLGFDCSCIVELKHQAKFHPLKFLYGLLEACSRNGVILFENTEAIRRDQHTVHTKEGSLKADWIIVATYNPFLDEKELYGKKVMYTSYVYEAHIPHGLLREAIYEDTDNPYHYFRVDDLGEYDRLIIGGEDHRSDIPIDPEKNYTALQKYMNMRFGGMEFKVKRKWRGPILEPVDGLAFIGSIDDLHILYATGFSGNGMTYAAISAQIFHDLISGKENKWKSLYEADRKLSRKALAYKGKDYAGELIGGALKNMFKK